MKIELNKIYNVDCLEFMKTLPDDYFDLVITDPPYGLGNDLTYHSQLTKSQDYGKYAWNDEIPSKEVFDEIFRVSKNQIIFGANHFIENMPLNSSCWIVWDKNNGGCDFADCELAWTSFNTAVRKFKYTWNGMIQENMKFKEKRFHPTQKPLALGRWIIKKYAKNIKSIFDPFAGSGTFLITSKEASIDFIGCEKEKKYCEIIEQRLQQRGINDYK